jgi:hypothetical protein
MALWCQCDVMTSSFFLFVLFVVFNCMTTVSQADVLLASGRNSIIPSCPVNCTCEFDQEATQLRVDCINRSDGNVSQLSDDINRLLTDVFKNATHLTIVNLHLTTIPSSVCQLKKLRSLQLIHNKLSKLPVSCFTAMEELEEFVAPDNELTEIQVGDPDLEVRLSCQGFPFFSFTSV